MPSQICPFGWEVQNVSDDLLRGSKINILEQEQGVGEGWGAESVRYFVRHMQGCHLSFTQNSLILPDFSLTFYSFPYPLKDEKNIFIVYFNGANYITSNLGVTLKGKNLLRIGM